MTCEICHGSRWKSVTVNGVERLTRCDCWRAVVVTKTLVIAGEGGFFTTPTGQRGAMLRAYNKATGNEVGAVYMPAPQTGSPITYLLNGKQYLRVARDNQVRTLRPR